MSFFFLLINVYCLTCVLSCLCIFLFSETELTLFKLIPIISFTCFLSSPQFLPVTLVSFSNLSSCLSFYPFFFSVQFLLLSAHPSLLSPPPLFFGFSQATITSPAPAHSYMLVFLNAPDMGCCKQIELIATARSSNTFYHSLVSIFAHQVRRYRWLATFVLTSANTTHLLTARIKLGDRCCCKVLRIQ